ncbi:hypothetical protein [Pseudonocardia sp. Ae717_Ps2]|uniref:hypothetical protein n=1 Tax=Pseudonocardia sp. Ae717_Ps2 TaxID=1885573 RepID=UPI0013015550|nr:hypothetical protein [Pseudonocardia sp. Ae717_Ps2]
MHRAGPIIALVAVLALVLSGCAGAGTLGLPADARVVTIAIVSNPQMQDAIRLRGRAD